MRTIRFATDFKEFIQLLNSHNVEYLLVGGYAVGYYGYPRATGDMDIWVASTPGNARRIVQALDDFGFGNVGASESHFLQPNKVVRMGNPPLRIELLTTISGVTFDACYAARIEAKIEELQVNVINLDDLRTNKLASGRPKDLDDLQNLGH